MPLAALVAALAQPCDQQPSVDLLQVGSSPDVTLDGVMGGQSSGSAYSVTLDGVMGGQSSGYAEGTGGNGVRFAGTINTDGGGFAYMTLSNLGGLNIGCGGLLITFDSMDYSTTGGAPLALELDASSGSSWCCTKSASFAVPSSEPSGITSTAFVPSGDWIVKGFWWTMGNSNWCTCGTNLDELSQLSIGIYFQQGPYDLTLRSIVTTNDTVDAAELFTPPLPSADAAPAALAAAMERADYMDGVGTSGRGGVGRGQMAAGAVTILETAAVQVARTDDVPAAAASALEAAADGSRAVRWSAAVGEGDPSATLTALRAEVSAAAALLSAVPEETPPPRTRTEPPPSPPDSAGPASTSPSTPPPASPEGSSSGAAVAVLAAVVGLLAAALVVVAFTLYRCRQQHRRRLLPAAHAHPASSTPTDGKGLAMADAHLSVPVVTAAPAAADVMAA